MGNPPRGPFDLTDPELVSVIDDLPLWSAPFGLTLLDTVKISRNMKALDVGCGLGFPLLELAQRLGPNSEVHGLDPWTTALERIRTKVRRRRIANVHLHEGVAEHLPFADQHFDLIVSNNGFNNVQDQPQAFAEAFRVSRPGAQLVLTANLPFTMKEFYKIFAEMLRESGDAAEIEALREHIASKRQPRVETETRLKAAGFRVARVVESEFHWRFADGTALFRHFNIRLAWLPSWRSVVPRRDAPAFFAALEERLNRAAAERGELSLTIPYVCIDCRRP